MNRKTIKADIERFMGMYALHCLKVLNDDAGSLVNGWMVSPGDTRGSSFLVLVHPEGVSIHGDMVMSSKIGSCIGAGPHYGLDWFVKKHEYDYLGKKFLTVGWCEEKAEQHITDLIEDYEKELEDDREVLKNLYPDDLSSQAMSQEGEALEDFEEFLNNLKDTAESQPWDEVSYSSAFGELLGDRGLDVDAIYPSQDYDHFEVVNLVCIQRTFAKLYHEKYGPKVAAA